MDSFLSHVFRAHGGLDTWMNNRSISAHLVQGGALWGLKGKAGVLDDTTVTVSTTEQWASHSPFGAIHRASLFQTKAIALLRTGSDVKEESRENPRSMFEGHTLETPWNDLQLAFFAGCAMWTYLNIPFLLRWPGVSVGPAETWQEKGEQWKKFPVEFPEGLEVFSKRQNVYFGEDGLLRRMDYNVEIAGDTPGAHYVSEYKEFDGILFPTKRVIYPRLPDGSSAAEPLVISIELDNIQLSSDGPSIEHRS